MTAALRRGCENFTILIPGSKNVPPSPDMRILSVMRFETGGTLSHARGPAGGCGCGSPLGCPASHEIDRSAQSLPCDAWPILHRRKGHTEGQPMLAIPEHSGRAHRSGRCRKPQQSLGNSTIRGGPFLLTTRNPARNGADQTRGFILLQYVQYRAQLHQAWHV